MLGRIEGTIPNVQFNLVTIRIQAVHYLSYEAIYGAAVTNNNLADGSSLIELVELMSTLCFDSNRDLSM